MGLKIPSRPAIFRIQDILDAIEKIERYTNGLTFQELTQNGLVIDAVITNFIIIGEASGHIHSSIQQDCPQIPWEELTNLINILVNEDFSVNSKILWSSIKENLPILQKQFKELLQYAKS